MTCPAAMTRQVPETICEKEKGAMNAPFLTSSLFEAFRSVVRTFGYELHALPWGR